MKAIRTALSLAAALMFLVGAAGCNTTEGFGRDMSKAGRSLSSEAREHK